MIRTHLILCFGIFRKVSQMFGTVVLQNMITSYEYGEIYNNIDEYWGVFKKAKN